MATLFSEQTQPTDLVMDDALQRASSADMVDLIRMAARRGLLRGLLDVRFVIERSDTGQEWGGGTPNSGSRRGARWVTTGKRYKRQADAENMLRDVQCLVDVARIENLVTHRVYVPDEFELRVVRVYTVTIKGG